MPGKPEHGPCGCESHKGHGPGGVNADGGDTSATSGDATGGNGGNANADGGDAFAGNLAGVFQLNRSGWMDRN